jgi:hypothetical protein
MKTCCFHIDRHELPIRPFSVPAVPKSVFRLLGHLKPVFMISAAVFGVLESLSMLSIRRVFPHVAFYLVLGVSIKTSLAQAITRESMVHFDDIFYEHVLQDTEL